VQATIQFAPLFTGSARAVTVPALTKEKMALAAKEFEVPAGTQMLLVFPKIFDRDLLLIDPLLSVARKSKDPSTEFT
jgi:hypothetical protein